MVVGLVLSWSLSVLCVCLALALIFFTGPSELYVYHLHEKIGAVVIHVFLTSKMDSAEYGLLNTRISCVSSFLGENFKKYSFLWL